MQAIDQFCSDLEQRLPAICSDQDLVSAGIASSPTLCRARKCGSGPSYIRIHRRKIMYLREDILSWMRDIYVVNKLKGEGGCQRE